MVSIGVVWDSERPPADQVNSVLKAIGTSLRLCDVFHQVSDSRWAHTVSHELVGVVAYYGKHYTTFFFHTKLRVWVYFDDANVKEVGKEWDSVVDKCSRGRYQPLLLLYASPQPPHQNNGQPQTYSQVENIHQLPPHRRAVTPSPEKPPMGNTRRAITPTPNRPICEYQNLSVIQNKIFANDENYISRRAVENVLNAQYQNLSVIQDKIFLNSHDDTDGYVSKRPIETVNSTQIAKKQAINLHRSLSAESSSISPPHPDGLSIPDHLNQPRRRDSGNWSGDRNSASSSSSTTLDNPYLYLVGKRNGSGSVPQSPTRTGQCYDAGYDSYSLSSTDSYPPKHHNIQLAKIPESVVLSGDCEKLCMEADQLLEKSKLLEDAHDLETALVLCNAAAGKARAAMDAPYSNPHTMTFARMKHNTCVMRARSLHRRILMEKGGEVLKDQNFGTNSIRHSRQNSKDGGKHSRQNSRELINVNMEKSPAKSIEIYATLPKKKISLKLMESDTIEYEQVKPERESRSIFGRSSKDKRSRSEDRNKINREFQGVEQNLINAKDTLKKHKEEKEEKKEKESKGGKKQHKIRRKLLMGGLIRRKNRSMPDLTDANADDQKKDESKSVVSVDDSSLGMNPNKETNSGYLSEGHFDYQVSNTNPNLERSKLMRKSFHGSGKTLTIAKVPPPPPLRTTSSLTQQQLQQHQSNQPQAYQKYSYNQQQKPIEYSTPSIESAPIKPFHEANASIISNMSSNTSMSEDSCQTIITTCAVVHQEQSPIKHNESPIGHPYQLPQYQQYGQHPQHHQQQQQQPQRPSDVQSVDEVDTPKFSSILDLPPYPSPPTSTCHSRQASEEFPPPPAAIDLEPLNEQLSEIQNLQTKRSNESSGHINGGTTSILAQLQQRQLMMNKAKSDMELTQQLGPNSKNADIRSETWLKELQAKQIALKNKKQEIPKNGTKTEAQILSDLNSRSVRDLASRFEQIKLPANGLENQMQQNLSEIRPYSSQELLNKPQPSNVRTGMSGLLEHKAVDEVDCAFGGNKNKLSYDLPKPRYDIAQSQIAEEIREVEMLNAVVQQTLNNGAQLTVNIGNGNLKRMKKKSVSFCDQVTLVATANDEEDDDFVPNPILERVLRNAAGSSSDSESTSSKSVDNHGAFADSPTMQQPLTQAIQHQQQQQQLLQQQSQIQQQQTMQSHHSPSAMNDFIQKSLPLGKDEIPSPRLASQQMPVYQNPNMGHNNMYYPQNGQTGKPMNYGAGNMEMHKSSPDMHRQYQVSPQQQQGQFANDNKLPYNYNSQVQKPMSPQNVHNISGGNEIPMQKVMAYHQSPIHMAYQTQMQQQQNMRPMPNHMQESTMNQQHHYKPQMGHMNMMMSPDENRNILPQNSNAMHPQYHHDHMDDNRSLSNTSMIDEVDGMSNVTAVPSQFRGNYPGAMPQNVSPYMTVPQTQQNGHAVVRDNMQGYPTTSNSQPRIPMNGGGNLNMINNNSITQHLALNRQISQNIVYQKPPTPANVLMQNANFQNYLTNNNNNNNTNPNPNNQMYNYQQQLQQKTNIVQSSQQINPPAVSATSPSPYQRVPMPQDIMAMNGGYADQQQQPKMIQKKVSFEPGTKGGPECPSPTLSATSNTTSSSLGLNGMNGINSNGLSNSNLDQTAGLPTRIAISTGYNNTEIVKTSAKAVQCNLCRKKHTVLPSIYCTDCEFYMSRFQTRR